jgi:sugar O-acyltransferase (sialic acid O-acetyltransferase NeuD family)
VKNLIFWGGTGQAKVLREALYQSEFQLVAVFDNREVDPPFPDIPLHVGRSEFESWLNAKADRNDLYACVAVGGSRGKERLEIQRWLEQLGIEPLTIVHSRAFLARDAIVGKGSQLLAMSSVCASTRLGEAVIVNTSASVDHDCVLGDAVHIGPGACVAGEVKIGEHAFIGAGSVILPRIEIGQGAIVGAGSVVTKNVAAGQTVVGSPAIPLDR